LASTRKGNRWTNFRQSYKVRLLPHGVWPGLAELSRAELRTLAGQLRE